MRSIVLAPDVLAQAILSPGTLSRKLLVVCAYGRIRQASELVLTAEENQISQEQTEQGGTRGGPPAEVLQAMNADEWAKIEEKLVGAPQDLVLTTSDRLIGRAETEIAGVLSSTQISEPEASPQSAAAMLTLCSVRILEESEYDDDDGEYVSPGHTHYPGPERAAMLNHVIDVGLISGSTVVVSDDPSICNRQFAGSGREIDVHDQETIRHLLGPTFDLSSVRGELLNELVSPVSSTL
jgi:hypothetical protein